MKKYNILILYFITIVCFGCNSNNDSHKLVCNLKKETEEQTITIGFNNNDSKVLNVKIETVLDASDYDESRKQQFIAFSEAECSDPKKINCYVLLEDNRIIEYMEMFGNEFFEDDRKTIDELQDLYENDGFSCER